MSKRWSARAAARATGTSILWSALTPDGGAAIWRACRTPGEVAEWLKAADCKSARASVRWFESSPLHHRHRSAAAGELLRIGCSRPISGEKPQDDLSMTQD